MLEELVCVGCSMGFSPTGCLAVLSGWVPRCCSARAPLLVGGFCRGVRQDALSQGLQAQVVASGRAHLPHSPLRGPPPHPPPEWENVSVEI